jgi:hypothetical protein
MGTSERSKPSIGRRGFLVGATSAAALAGPGAGESWAAQSGAGVEPASSLGQLAMRRQYRTRRSSSYDRSGGNADFARLQPGATLDVLNTEGPGMVTHLWFTINSHEEYHLKKLVLRAYWDGESEPSVEVPLGDFFGLGLGDYFLYHSALTSVASIKAMNAYFPMPFAKAGRITLSNEGTKPADSVYYNIDFVSFREVPGEMGYFHAQYRQATPCHGWTGAWQTGYEGSINERKNLTGEGNYVFLNAQGLGHFIGVTHAVLQNQNGWWGEGDEMILIDGKDRLNGTGTEDYYNGAWNFGGLNAAQPFSYLHNGAPYIVNPERVGGRYCLYRWHLESPITFEKSIEVSIEHGHANHRSDSFFSTAYWYQTEPHAKFPALAPAADRIPHVIEVGGPGVSTMPAGSGK